MKRDEALRLLAEHKVELTQRFGVKRLALFGSTARDEAGDDSDVDMLVDFSMPATFDAYFDLKFFLEDLLKHEVDLVCEDALRPRLKSRIEQDAIDVA
jgi:predicted nucleotidyltransferase